MQIPLRVTKRGHLPSRTRNRCDSGTHRAKWPVANAWQVCLPRHCLLQTHLTSAPSETQASSRALWQADDSPQTFPFRHSDQTLLMPGFRAESTHQMGLEHRISTGWAGCICHTTAILVLRFATQHQGEPGTSFRGAVAQASQPPIPDILQPLGGFLILGENQGTSFRALWQADDNPQSLPFQTTLSPQTTARSSLKHAPNWVPERSTES